jgi:hypothetical protein
VTLHRPAQRPCDHPSCHRTYCRKKTHFYENVLSRNEKGYHLRRTAGFGRKRKRQLAAYECLDPECHYDYRVAWNEDLVEEWGAPFGCPLCGSCYVEWLSYLMDPADVFLDTEEEWALVPPGKVRNVCSPASMQDSGAGLH